jgi:hypothetical protein
MQKAVSKLDGVRTEYPSISGGKSISDTFKAANKQPYKCPF